MVASGRNYVAVGHTRGIAADIYGSEHIRRER